MKVKVNNPLFQPRTIVKGIPQGSVLSVTLHIPRSHEQHHIMYQQFPSQVTPFCTQITLYLYAEKTISYLLKTYYKKT